MIKIVSLMMCLFLPQKLIASNLLAADQLGNSKANVLKLTCIEHDFEKKPARMYFESDGIRYTLCDSDGGAMIALIYSICLQEPRKHMVNTDPNNGKMIWDEIKDYKVKSFERVRQLLIHSLNRLESSAFAEDAARLKSIQNLRGRLDGKQEISYEELYLNLGVWLKVNYRYLKKYPIDITEGSLQPLKTVMGIQFCKDVKDPGYTCVGNTLAFFSKLKKLELPVSKVVGCKELVVEDLATITKAYDIARSPDQNLGSDYHIHKIVELLPNGAIKITLVAYPDREKPKAAYTKKSKGRKKSDVK